MDGGDPRPIPGLRAKEYVTQWSEDGRFIFARVAGSPVPLRLVKIDLTTGQREPWLELAPPDLAGVGFVYRYPFSSITPDGRCYAYGYQRDLSDLYVIEGLR